jgi:hypothetical protein
MDPPLPLYQLKIIFNTNIHTTVVSSRFRFVNGLHVKTVSLKN